MLTFSRVAKTCAWGMNQSCGRIRGRVRQQRHFGVAVHVDFFDVVGVFEVVEGLVAGQLLVPAELAKGVAHFDKAGQAGVVAQKMCVAVDDELARQFGRALVGEVGCGGFGEARVKDLAEHLVDRDERSRHAGRSLEKPTPRQALAARQPIAQLLEPGLDRPLLFRLRHRHVLVARHDLGRHRRRKGRGLGRQQFGQLFVSKKLHALLPKALTYQVSPPRREPKPRVHDPHAGATARKSVASGDVAWICSAVRHDRHRTGPPGFASTAKRA